MKTKISAVLISTLMFLFAGVSSALAQVSPTFHPSTAPLVSLPVVANASSTGTTLAALAKLTGVNTAVIAATSDNKNGSVIGVVVAGAGTSGSATILSSGAASCKFDATSVVQDDFVTVSTTTAGDCHDAGTTIPGDSSQILGKVGGASGAGSLTYPVIFAITPSAGPSIQTFQNCATSASCASAAVFAPKVVQFTQVAFSSSTTLALTGMPAFTGTTTYECFVQDTTHPSYTFGTANQSATATTITASTSNSDSVNVGCIGY